jgi:hypothetical protein
VSTKLQFGCFPFFFAREYLFRGSAEAKNCEVIAVPQKHLIQDQLIRINEGPHTISNPWPLH